MVKNFLPTTFSAASYASAVVFVRFAYAAGLNPGTAIFLRFVLAGLVLGAFLRLSRRWQSLPVPQVAALCLLGFLAYTVMGVTWFVALDLTPAWLVALTMSVFPLIVSLGSWLFLRQQITWIQAASLAAVMAGGGLIFWRPIEGRLTIGLVLMAVNLLTNAAYYLLACRAHRC
jgi:drug/metabolite transporter (DMT)-like permease